MLQDVTRCYKLLQVVTWCYKMLQDITRCYKLLQVVSSCYKMLQDPARMAACYRLLQVVTRFILLQIVFHSFSQSIKVCQGYWKDQHLVEKQTIATGFQGKGAVGALVELVAGVRVWIHLDKPWSQSFNLKVSLPEAPQALGTQLQWQVLQWVQAGRQEEVEAELALVQELPAGRLQLEQRLQDELGRSLYLVLCLVIVRVENGWSVCLPHLDGRCSGTAGTFSKAVGRRLKTFNIRIVLVLQKEKKYFWSPSHLAAPTTSKVSAILKQWVVREVLTEINNFFGPSSPLQ